MTKGKTITIVLLAVLCAVLTFAWLYAVGTTVICEGGLADNVIRVDGISYDMHRNRVVYISNEGEVFTSVPEFGQFYYIEADTLYFTTVEEIVDLLIEE